MRCFGWLISRMRLQTRDDEQGMMSRRNEENNATLESAKREMVEAIQQGNDENVKRLTGSLGSKGLKQTVRVEIGGIPKVFSGSNDNTVRVWDLETMKEKACLTGHIHTVRSVAITKDGKTAVSGSDKTVMVWDLETMKLKARLTGHRDLVMSVGISEDGKTAVSGSEDKSVRVWDLETMKEKACLTGHCDAVTSVSLKTRERMVSSSLHVAALRGSWPICQMLLEKGGPEQRDIRDSLGRTAAEMARERRHDELAERIENWVRRESWVELLSAVQGKDVERVRRQLNRRADLSMQDKDGWTVLHWAAQTGEGEVLKCLLQAGGKKLREMRCHGGNTARDVASRINNEEAVAAIEAAEKEEEKYSQGMQRKAQELVDKYRSEEKEGSRLLSVEEYRMLVKHTPLEDKGNGEGKRKDQRFKSDSRTSVCGEFKHAARGLEQLLQVPLKEVYQKTGDAIQKMREEVETYWNAELKRDLEYVLSEAAREEETTNGIKDKGHGGMRLQDFMRHRFVKEAQLLEEELAALRLYTMPRILWRGMKNLRMSDKFAMEGGTELAPMPTTT
eukprot:407598-Hanusia_phi.AAC.2